ncbi:hypothetical protein KSC_027790 [Ktedonobacter sp. SOSP1-52]|nr:hypothetical protein KSC_027790 [Ktedonobacter sp. SOSP1-52]
MERPKEMRKTRVHQKKGHEVLLGEAELSEERKPHDRRGCVKGIVNLSKIVEFKQQKQTQKWG